MPRLKDETLSIRTSAEIKQLLRMAADGERRSVASMIEVLVLEYAKAHNLKPSRPVVALASAPAKVAAALARAERRGRNS